MKFLGSYPVAGRRGGRRAAARGRQGVARRGGVGRRAARARSATTDARDRPQAAARRARVPRAASSASACATGLIDEVLAADDDAPRAACQRSRSCARARTRRRRRSARPRPTSGRRRSRPRPRSRRSSPRSEPALAEARGDGARARAPGAEPGRRVGARRRRGRRRGRARRSATTDRRARARPRRVRRGDRASSTPSTAAEASGSRFAYLMREAVLLELALVQWVMGTARRARASRRSCRRCSCASTRWRRPGFFPTDRAQVYDVDDGELFLVGTSEVPLSALHRGEIARRRRAAAPLRRLSRRASGARRAPTARTPAASSACTSSTRSRCSRTAHPTSRGTSTSASSRSRSRSSAGSGCPYRVVNIAAGDLGAAGGEEVRHRGVAAVGGPVPRAHVVLELPRLLGPPARHARAGRRRHRARAHAQRHRVRDQPHARVPVRALPGGRRRSPSPTCCGRSPAFRPWKREAEGTMSLGPNDRCWCGSEHEVQEVPPPARRAGEAGHGRARSVRCPTTSTGRRTSRTAGNPPTRNERLVKPPEHRRRDAQGRARRRRGARRRRRRDRTRGHDRRARRGRARGVHRARRLPEPARLPTRASRSRCAPR